ncbi:hypothetical protein ACIGB8_02120 [Promicromonospora sukumoe]|uniref:hypothetical protein n=1 Tax=Promicromonospora sukumoe TaxID=88382 RepID=UPI0037C7A2C0
MTSHDVVPPTRLRTFLPGLVSRITFGALLVALVVRLTGDVEPWGEEGLTPAVVAHLLLLPLLALTLWAASGTPGTSGRPRPVVLTLVALALGYLGDPVVAGTLLSGVWEALMGSMELEGIVYQAMMLVALLALALVAQTLAFRGWLGAGRLYRLAGAACWVVGVAAVAVVVSGLLHLDLAEYVVGAVTAGAAWCVAVAFLAVAAWRVDRLAGTGALLHVATAVLAAAGLLVGDSEGVYQAVLRLSAVVYVAGQALLATGLLRSLREDSIRFERLA